MALTAFIPEVWSARLQEGLHRDLVIAGLCNRSYEGEIRHRGDTVHIGVLTDVTVRDYDPASPLADPEPLSGTDTTLTIDHGTYFNFYMNDVDTVQSKPDLMDAAVRSAAVKVSENVEDYILSVIREGAKTKLNLPVPDAGVYGLIVDLKLAMDNAKVPRTGRSLVIPPSMEADLLLDSRFVTGTAQAEHRLAEGSVARAAGFDIYISTELTDQVIAMGRDTVTYAEQISEMEAYRPEKSFADGVKGLHLCGAKVLQPEGVFIWNITAA